ncbi:uncharacterized protein LOC133470697 [Phyllopteryx taeniolatus]|uniref:uncharacterized protein LOC133470697 n=1 Tax=Phyllopteryx taeniolatus TaxID=161469 RepID=UPI002AD3307E|nr:uncharacterized protein LOC133470697 [Phyllopteryx taeniolatus]
MSKKAFTKRSFVKLFSRSEPDLHESPVKTKTDEKKRFKLPKLKIKSKGGPSSEKQLVFSPAELSNSPVDGPGRADNVLDKSSSSIYATARRSKAQELSNSETDLQKPNKFATFSFGLFKKKKKKKEDNLSRSTFGLHRSDIEEQQEKHADFKQMVDDQGSRKAMLSVSQPALDTSDNFDIPSPPSIHSKLLESYFALSQQTPVTHTAKPGPQEHLTNHSDLLLHHEGQNSPTANIPDLQQYDRVQSGEKETIPVGENQSESNPTSIHTSVWMTSASSAAETASQPNQLPLLDASEQIPDKVVDGNLAVTRIEDHDVFQQSDADILIRQPRSVPLSHVLDTRDRRSPNGEPSLTYDDANATLLPEPVPYTESAEAQQEVIFLHTEQSIPETAENTTKTLSISNQKIDPPVNQDVVYVALYESLFPRSFTSEILSSLPTSRADISPETRNVTKSEPLMVETPSYFQKETDVIYSRRTTSVTSRNDSFSAHNDLPSHQRFYSYNTLTSAEAQINSEIPGSYLPSSSHSSTYSYSEQPDESPYSVHVDGGNSLSLYEKALSSIPLASNSAPPLSDYVTSRGMDTQVTDSKQRVILVKEVVADGKNGDSGLSSSKPNEMTTDIGLKIKMDAADKEFGSFPPPGLTEPSPMPCSPVYLSVGSDDGSTMDIYFSAEEDNMDSLDEQTHIMDKIEESLVGPSEVTNFQRFSLKKEHFELLNTAIEGSKIANNELQERIYLQDDMQQLLRRRGEEFQGPVTGRTEFLKVEDGSIEEIDCVTKVLPKIKEEEFLVTPVLQVNTPLVCEFAAPSSNLQGEGTDETWINVNETARNLNEELLSHEIYYLQDGDAQSPKYLPQNNTRLEVEDLSTREVREAEEKLLPIADPIGEESPEHADTKIKTTKCANTESFGVADAATRLLMDNAELQSDSTTIECNRHPQQTEWVDTIAENAGNGAQQEQVAVELPDLKADTHHPPNDATKELFWRQERLPEVQAALKQRSSTVASEAFNVNYPKTNADQESDDKMNPGYSSLSTALSMKNSPPDKLDESRYRFRKVSLVHPTDNATQQDAVDFSRMESNGMTLSTDHSWTHSFDGASRFMPKEEPLFSDSPSYRLYDTSSSTYSTSFLPEATSYSYNSQSELGSSPTDYTDASCFTGVFKATLVELDDLAAPASSPPASPDQFEMDNLKDTLKNMGPSLRPRSISLRGLAPAPVSALAPIVEDAPTPITADVVSLTKRMEASAAEAQNGVFTLPTDLGLKRNLTRDTRSPMELMKKKEQPGASDMPLRLSATSSILMRKSSDSSDEHKSLNGNGTQQSPTNSRLENSVIFGSYRPSTLDQRQENGKIHRSVFRSGSLPDLGSSNILKEVSEVNTTTDSTSRFERLSFLRNSSPSSSSFSTGADDLTTRKSLLPLQNITSSASSSSSSRLLSPTSSLENYRLFPTTESSFYSEFGQTVSQGTGTSTLSTPVLQRSFSHDSISAGTQQNLLINNNLLRGSHVQKTEPERIVKYRAFPDAYLTKEKEHGKLNPRPGKMYIFDRPGMCGQRIELRSDVVDATSWELQETISIRVLRGGWVLYEKRNFKGEKIALDEGDIELTCPFQKTEEEGEQQMNGQKVAEEQEGETNGETNEGQMKTKPARGFIIGSVRRAVRDYSVPEISLFPEENAEGKKVIFRDTSEDARIFGFPIKANSIIINAGLWLVFAKPFFEGVPRVLEVGGYSNPASWGVEQPYVGSLHPLKVGEPRVENISEPKIEIYERSYFTGKSRILTTNMKDFMTRVDRQQGAFMYSVGSLKVHGGIWVGYEKEGFRGNQYLLEEDEYHDWRVWGGSNSELRSVRVLQADLSEPLMVMFEQPEDEEGAPAQEENTFEVTEAIPDVELFDYKINTRSIQVFSGVWVAYSHVDFSGNQYILEKGFYRNCADWGSRDTRICSVQPVRLAPTDGNRTRNEILLYSEPEYKGKCLIFNYKQDAITEEFQTKSCRIVGGSWVLYENKDFTGTMYVLSEGRYSTLISMGCTPSTFIRSVKAVTLSFSVPSISLFGLEGLEGREITTDSELVSMVAEGFNDHILSVRVNSGYWVLCEFSHYRGRQFLLEPIEITNWPKFSSVQTVGSLYPVRQKRHFFRIRNTDSQHYMSIQGGVEEIKSGRVVVTPDVEPMSDIWFYQDGLIKNKLSPTMSLQVMGNIEPAAKLVLWSETRQPSQTWMAQMRGQLRSITFPGMVIDVKGGQSYDKEHVVIMPESDERLSQHWEIVMIN